MKIKEIRSKYPQYADMADGDLAKGLHKKFYADIPYADFLKKIDFSEGVNPTEGMSTWQQALAGIGKGMTDVAVGAGQRLGLVDQGAVDDRAALDAPLMDTTAGAVGNVAGKVAAAIPTMMIPGANTALGATAISAGMGALEPTKTGESVTQNMALSGAGGLLGHAGGSLLSRAIRPVQSELDDVTAGLARSAQQKGIPLDAADLTGSRPMTTMRDVFAQLPFTADKQAQIQALKQGAFNKAVSGSFGSADEALTPPALQAARTRIGQQFTDLSARNAANVDNVVLGKVSGIIDEANRYSTPDVARVVSNFADDILSRVDANGQVHGKAYRALDSQMGKAMRSTSNGDIRNAVGQLRDVLREAMDNSISTADQGAWQEARKQYANLMTVAPLAARSETGDVSGRSLLAAALRGGSGKAFSGGGELGELGRIGRAFVAEQTPNSGTAQRALVQSLLTGGGGAGMGAGAAYATGNDPIKGALYGAGAGATALALPKAIQSVVMSPAGQAYLSKGLAPMTPAQRALINALGRGIGASGALTYAE